MARTKKERLKKKKLAQSAEPRRQRGGTPAKEVQGVVSVSSRGIMFMDVDERRAGIQVERGMDGGALNGDKVLAVISAENRHGRIRYNARVTRVLSRADEPITGSVVLTQEGWPMLLPSTRQHPILRILEGDALPGDFAQARITRFSTDGSAPGCAITRVIGRGPAAELRAVALKFGLQDEFPQETLAEAEALPDDIRPEDLVGRADYRAQAAFTMDGEDAQDFDDAVFLRREGPLYRLYVHIADVSHYVRPGGAIDRTAYARGTSAYLPGLTLPMLPEKLSNNMCSLRPETDRLCITAELCFDAGGARVSSDVHTSVIRSHARMTYERVNAIIEGVEPMPGEGAVARQIPDMLELSRLLRERRLKRGALELDSPESHIIINADGGVEDIVPRGRGEAESVIEDFMIAANEAVARELRGLKLPCLYRVHEPPETDRVLELARKLAALHLRLEVDAEGNTTRRAMEEALETADPAMRPIISRLILRSLKRAEYLPQPLGHFGLAADDYCHFTAPIRRYPDLFVHRVLKARNDPNIRRLTDAWQRHAPDAARQSSERERAAQEAEWDAVALRCAQYMQGRVGEEYPAIITGMTKQMLFLTLESTIEVALPLHAIPDDYYEYVEERLVVIGRRKRKTYRLGQRLNVVVDSVDIPDRRVFVKLSET